MNLGIAIGIIGVLVSLIGIPIAYVMARRARQFPDLRYVTDFDVILNPDDRLLDHGLSMSIGSRRINSICRSRVAVWNKRGDTIRGGDIVNSDPLRIQFTEGDIALQVRTLTMSRPQNKLTPTINPTDEASVDVAFDFLDAGDGAIFEIVHLRARKPTLLGTIRGTKIRNCGSADISSMALASTKMSALRSFRELTPPREQRKVMLRLLAGLFYAIIGIVLAVKPGTSTHLVRVGNYNLRTIAGQADFANAVVRSNPNTIPYLAFIAICFFCAVYEFIVVARSFDRNKFPSSIAALIMDDDMQGDNADNPPRPEAQASTLTTSGNGPERL